jgi:hypothetical protein
MTDATTSNQESIELATPQNAATYNWTSFLAEGDARHLYSAGITNKGFDPKMITPDGLEAKTLNKKFPDQPFNVVYDKDYVLEILSRQIAALGIINGSTVDQAGMSWLLNELVTYAPKYAERNGKLVVDPTEKKARELAKMFPGKSFDEWLNELKVASQPKVETEVTTEAEYHELAVSSENAVVETEKNPSDSKAKKGKTVTA